MDDADDKNIALMAKGNKNDMSKVKCFACHKAGHYVSQCQCPYSRQIWHGNQGISGMDFETDFCFLFVILGPYGTVHTADCGHGKRGRRRSYSSTVLARKMR
jgi:hypothetical protein